MKYEIKAFNKDSGSIQVRFWTDVYPAGLLFTVDVPIVDGAYMTGKALNEHILSFAPHGQIGRMVEAAAIDAAAVEALVVPTVAPTKTPEQIAEAARLQAKKDRAEYVQSIRVQTKAGNWFDGDETSQTRMARAIIALQATGVPTVTWVLADNTVVQATAAELTEALALAGTAQASVWVL